MSPIDVGQLAERHPRRLRLDRFKAFLLAGAVLIGSAVIASGLAVSWFFEGYILAHEREHTSLEVRTEARQILRTASFERSGAQADASAFQSLLGTLPGVSSLRVLDRTGKIVWSQEPAHIGTTLSDNPHVAKALAGVSTAVVEGTSDYVARIYVAIALPGQPGVTGLIEVSKEFYPVVLGIRRTQRFIFGVAAAMGLFLYVALGFVVWRASVAERRALRWLEAKNLELTLIRNFTHSLLGSLELDRLGDHTVRGVGSGLDLSRAALFRVGKDHELSLVADWSAQGSAASAPPDKETVAEAVRERRPVMRGGTVAVALPMPSGLSARPDVARPAGTYLFVAVFRRPEPAMPLLLDIMLDEAAISLANAELFTVIREAHERLAAILAGIADRMVIVDRELRVVWMNAVAADAYGHGSAAVGRPCFEILGGGESCADCPAVRTFHSRDVERGMRVERLRGGEVRHLDVVTTPLLDPSGSARQVLEVARDVTELVQLEERLKESAARLQESHGALLTKTDELGAANAALRQAQARLVDKERLAAVGQLVVGLHHSILNPLAGILGALQVLKDPALEPAKRAEAFSQAEAEIRKVERVVRSLSALRRVTGTPYVGEATMLDLERSCGEAGRTAEQDVPSEWGKRLSGEA